MKWILKQLLKLRKMKAYIEVSQDIKFIEVELKDKLNYDIGSARKELSKLNSKENPTSDESIRLSILSVAIAQHQATKKEHTDLKVLQKNIPKYIKLI